jgi:threonine aldolase
VLGSRSHIYWFERQNIATVGGRVPRLVDENRLGELPLEGLEGLLEAGPYVERPAVAAIAIENTHNVAGGACLSATYVEAVAELARRERLALYVDGARLVNAAVAQDVALSALAAPADAVAISLNKGLGAPYGSILAGGRALIERAREHVWSFGGHSVHRAGIFAAAALVALETGFAEVERDHATAHALATELAAVEGVSVDLELVRTNLVRVDLDDELVGSAVVERLGELGVGAGLSEPQAIRFATHRGFEAGEVSTVRDALAEAIAACRQREGVLEPS